MSDVRGASIGGFMSVLKWKNQSFQIFYTINKQESTVMMCCISTSETCLPKKSRAKMRAIESALSCLPFSLQALCLLQQNHMLICISTTATYTYWTFRLSSSSTHHSFRKRLTKFILLPSNASAQDQLKFAVWIVQTTDKLVALPVPGQQEPYTF